jgi:hypothetical protein
MSNIDFVDDGSSINIPLSNQSNIIPVDNDDSTTIEACSNGEGLLDIESVSGCSVVNIVNPLVHNNLDGLQGGTTTQRYHVSKGQWQAINAAHNPSLTNPFATLTDLGAIGNFVPYVGATQDVDIGNNQVLGRSGQFHSWRIGINPAFGKFSFTSDGDQNNPSAVGRSLINFNYNDSTAKSLQYNPVFFSNQGLYWGNDRLLTSIDAGNYVNLTTNQTISGNKTFVQNVQAPSFTSSADFPSFNFISATTTVQILLGGGARRNMFIQGNVDDITLPPVITTKASVSSAPVSANDVVRLTDLAAYSGLSTPSNQGFQI